MASKRVRMTLTEQHLRAIVAMQGAVRASARAAAERQLAELLHSRTDAHAPRLDALRQPRGRA